MTWLEETWPLLVAIGIFAAIWFFVLRRHWRRDGPRGQFVEVYVAETTEQAKRVVAELRGEGFTAIANGGLDGDRAKRLRARIGSGRPFVAVPEGERAHVEAWLKDNLEDVLDDPSAPTPEQMTRIEAYWHAYEDSPEQRRKRRLQKRIWRAFCGALILVLAYGVGRQIWLSFS